MLGKGDSISGYSSTYKIALHVQPDSLQADSVADNGGEPGARPDSLQKDSLADSLGIQNGVSGSRFGKTIPSVTVNRYTYGTNPGCQDSIEQYDFPENSTISAFDTTSISAHNLQAVQDYFRTTYRSAKQTDLFTVKNGDQVYKSTAMLLTMPYFKALSECRRVKDFNSTEEFSSYSDSLQTQFQRQITIRLDLISNNINAVSLDTTELFDVRLQAFDQFLKPLDVVYFPVKSKIVAFQTWYQRRVLLSFERYNGLQDYLSDYELALVIRLKVAPEEADYQRVYRFNILKSAGNQN